MYTIKDNVKSEIIINKSKFITYIYKVKSIEEVESYMQNLKKEYKDATHICYSYIIDNTKRFNDDGEPGGTAGMPILNVLENNKLNYVFAAVVRYFGGIKLGAGGLVRAYTNSITTTLNETVLNELIYGSHVSIKFNYDNSKQIDNILKNTTVEKKYDDYVYYEFDTENKELINKLTNLVIDINVIDNIIIEKETI